MGWLRILLTEYIVISLYIFLFCELFSATISQRINYLRLGLIAIIGFWIRYDFILVLPLIFGVLVYLIGFKKAVLKTGTLFLIILVSFSLWSYRSLSKDLSFSDMINLPKDSLSYLKWFQTWHLNPHDAQVYWNSFSYQYQTVHIPERAYWSQSEAKEIKAIMTELQTEHIGKPMPEQIQSGFRRIAAKKKEDFPFRYYISHPLQRLMMMMYGSPASSFGMPIIYESADHPLIMSTVNRFIHQLSTETTILEKLNALSEINPLLANTKLLAVTIFKVTCSFYQYALLTFFVLMLILFKKKRLPKILTPIISGIGIHFLSLNIIWLYMGLNFEVRYQLPLYIMIQLFLVTYICYRKTEHNNS